MQAIYLNIFLYTQCIYQTVKWVACIGVDRKRGGHENVAGWLRPLNRASQKVKTMSTTTLEGTSTEARNVGRVIGQAPGVAGCSHNGAVYCVDCAMEISPATLTWLRDGNPSALPWTSPILRSAELLNKHTHCERCDCKLAKRGYRFPASY
jgi:hypothetical protein